MNYIMFASHLDKKKISVESIIEAEQSPMTIIVAKRETGWNKFSPLFIVSGEGTTMQLGSHEYTQDTGLGHKNKGKQLIVENVIKVDRSGVITKTINSIGLTEKRSPWVFK